MRVIGTTIIAAAAFFRSTEAFSPAASTSRVSYLSLSAAAVQIKNEVAKKYIRKQIDNLTAENFDSNLKDIEPYLLNDSGFTFYTKCMNRISVKAKFLGKTVPAGYAKEAKATEKRREKQGAFIQTKIEEAEAAAAEAAAAEAAAAEASEGVGEDAPAAE